MALAPHSMQVERIISSYNLIDDNMRASLLSDTIDERLIIALNGDGTAGFDPRQAIGRFLGRKQRRYKEPTSCIFKEREFIRKFFRTGTHI